MNEIYAFETNVVHLKPRTKNQEPTIIIALAFTILLNLKACQVQCVLQSRKMKISVDHRFINSMRQLIRAAESRRLKTFFNCFLSPFLIHIFTFLRSYFFMLIFV